MVINEQCLQRDVSCQEKKFSCAKFYVRDIR